MPPAAPVIMAIGGVLLISLILLSLTTGGKLSFSSYAKEKADALNYSCE